MQNQIKNMLKSLAIIFSIYSCEINSEKKFNDLPKNTYQSEKTIKSNWLKTFDFDGDGINNYEYFDF